MRNALLIATLTMFATTHLAAGPVHESTPKPITSKNVQELRQLATLQKVVYGMEWVPNTDELAVADFESEIEAINPRSLTTTRKIAAGKHVVHFAFSRDGKQLAWCPNENTFTIENLVNGTREVHDSGNPQPHLVFSPDGKWLASGGYGTKAWLWNLEFGSKIRSLDTDRAGGLTPVFSPDGKILALGNRNSTTRLFEAPTGKLLHVLPKSMTQGIRFNPAGTILATAYVDGTIGLWDVQNGKSLFQVKTSGEELYTVDWNPTGRLLVTAGLHAKITIWDATSLKPLKEFDAGNWIIAARFSRDGSRLFTAGGDMDDKSKRLISVWGLPDDR